MSSRPTGQGSSQTRKRRTGASLQDDRVPLQPNGRNYKIGLKVLPRAAAKRLQQAWPVVPLRVRWNALEVKSGARGRRVLQFGDVRVGPERDPAVTADHIRAHDFFATKGDRNHVDANFDRVLAMRAPFHPGQFHQRLLLAVSGQRADRSKPVVTIPMMRMSSRQQDAIEQVQKRCPDGLHEFAPGQGPGNDGTRGYGVCCRDGAGRGTSGQDCDRGRDRPVPADGMAPRAAHSEGRRDLCWLEGARRGSAPGCRAQPPAGQRPPFCAATTRCPPAPC